VDLLAVPQISAAVITASVALLVGVVAAVVTPATTSLRARRQAVHDKFDAALAANLLVQAARWSPTGMRESPAGRTPEEHRALDLRMNEKGIEFFVERMADAKVALVAIAEHVPEIRERLTTGWELTEADEPVLGAAIEKRRPAAVKAERLFRQRKPRLT
jgi:hypothetical protein